MNRILFILFLTLVLPWHSFGKGLTSTRKSLKTPPRVIRACCAFGSDLGFVGVPFFRYTRTTDMDQIGQHVYLGNKNEGNGIVYTCKGGFIDLGHLRDQADWTAFLHYMIIHHKGKKMTFKLGYEGGVKRLTLHVPDTISDGNCVRLAGRIAYDLSVWHEIASWYGASEVPFVPERYSAFSIEDDFSNLLGVNLAMDAIKSDQPFNDAMTSFLENKLLVLGVVDSEKETLDAIEKVEDEWWTRDKKFPSRKILIEHNFSTYSGASPMLVPDWCETNDPVTIDLPLETIEHQPLTDFYELDLKLNGKFPFRKIFPDKKGRGITEEDFKVLLEKVIEDVNRINAADNLKELKKQQRKEDRKG